MKGKYHLSTWDSKEEAEKVLIDIQRREDEPRAYVMEGEFRDRPSDAAGEDILSSDS